MYRTHFVLCISALIVCSMPVAAQDLPGDVTKAIKEANAEINKTREEARSGAASDESKFLKALKKLQDEFTKSARLDEAVAIRDLLKSVGNEKNSDERKSLLKVGTNLVPEEAGTIINEYLSEAEEGEEELALLLERLEKAKRERLQPLFDKYSQAGDLDVAIALRDAMKPASLEQIAVDAPGPKNSMQTNAPQVLPLSSNPASARREHQEQMARQTTWLHEQNSKVMPELFLALERLQEKETKAGRLDDAVKLRDSLGKIKAMKASVDQVRFIRESRATLPASSWPAIDKTLKSIDDISKVYEEARLKADKALAKAIEPEVIKTMLTNLGKYEALRTSAHEYYLLSRDTSGLQAVNDGREQIQECEAAREGLEKLAEFLQNKTEQVAKDESNLRVELVAKLKKLMDDPQLTATQKEAIGKVVEFAEADYSKGPLGMTLLSRSLELPESARVTLAESRKQVRGIMETARADVDNSWTQLTKDLEPTIKQLITESKFATVVQIKRQLQVSPPLEFSIPIKFNRIAHSDHCWDATLVDVRGDNCFLVDTGNDRHEWLPRCRIKFLPEDKVQVANLGSGEKPAGPGIPIAAGMKLKKGQKAFKHWGNSWQPVTIEAVTPEGISFTWDGWSRREEVAPRTELLLLED